MTSSNFDILKTVFPEIATKASECEKKTYQDPGQALIEWASWLEYIFGEIEEQYGMTFGTNNSLADKINTFLGQYLNHDPSHEHIRQDFNELRIKRNQLAHPPRNSDWAPPREIVEVWAKSALYSAYRIGLWLALKFGKGSFEITPFMLGNVETSGLPSTNYHGLPPEGWVRDDEAIPVETKYRNLYYYLAQHAKQRHIVLSFIEVETILTFELPQSARKHAAWWSGERPHTRAWKNLGYRASPNFQSATVTFSRG